MYTHHEGMVAFQPNFLNILIHCLCHCEIYRTLFKVLYGVFFFTLFVGWCCYFYDVHNRAANCICWNWTNLYWPEKFECKSCCSCITKGVITVPNAQYYLKYTREYVHSQRIQNGLKHLRKSISWSQWTLLESSSSCLFSLVLMFWTLVFWALRCYWWHCCRNNERWNDENQSYLYSYITCTKKENRQDIKTRLYSQNYFPGLFIPPSTLQND